MSLPLKINGFRHYSELLGGFKVTNRATKCIRESQMDFVELGHYSFRIEYAPNCIASQFLCTYLSYYDRLFLA